MATQDDTTRTKARGRALRAARVVTLGLVLATPGCYLVHDLPLEPPGREADADAGEALADAGTDAGVGTDAGTDASADAGVCAPDERWAECCEAIGWDWDRGCA